MAHPRTPIGVFGSISSRRNPNGTYTARTRYRDEDGKARDITATGPNARAAERTLKARIAERSRCGAYGGDLTPESPFPKLAEVWLAQIKATDRLAPNTKESYEWNLEHYVLPEFRDFTIAEVTVQSCERFLQKQAALSSNKARQSRRTLSLVLGAATRFGLLPANPVRECSKLARPKKRPDALSIDETKALRAGLRQWRQGAGKSGPPPDGQLATAVDLMLATSGRIGEVLALRRCDVDLNACPPTVRIRGTMIYPKKAEPYRQEFPKTDAGRRIVALPSWAANSLQDRMADVPDEASSLVFFSRNGTPMRSCNVRRLLRQVCAAIGLEGVHPHKFRRTAATYVARNSDVELAAKLLGHSSSAITIEHYIERVERVDEATATILEAFGEE